MYEITIKKRFAAAHKLEGHDGECAALHGHTWTVEVTVAGDQLDQVGMLIDFKTLKEAVDEIIRQLDHSYLNGLEYFSGPGLKKNPTAENLAVYIYRRLSEDLKDTVPGIAPRAVKIWESPDTSALYREE